MDATRCLDLAAIADGLAHERHVVHRGASRREAGAGLHERGSCGNRVLAGADDLLVIEEAALQNDLHGVALGSPDDGCYVIDDVLVVASDEVTAIDHHVDLCGPVRHGLGGLGGLRLRGAGTQREADAGGHAHAGARKALGSHRRPARVDCNRREVVLGRLVAQALDVCLRRVLLEIGVIDVAIEFHNILPSYEDPPIASSPHLGTNKMLTQ